MNTNNSISSVIKQLLEINVNSIKTFERINEAVTTDKQTIPLELLASDGTTQTVYVPAFGYMKRELERLDQNVKALTDLGDSTSKIKLPDGTYQRIYTGTLKSPANDIGELVSPSEFGIKSNYFFEDFLNPLLTTKFDVSGKISSETERVLVKRYIIDTSFDFAKEWFEPYKEAEDIDYNSFVSDLSSNNIPFFEDEEVRDLPYKSTQYYGTFDVTSIDNVESTVIKGGQEVINKVKLYTLDQLTYTDSEKDLKNTELLRTGDELIINSGKKSTKYRIKNIINSTRQVALELIQGYEAIRIGANVLRIHKANEIKTEVEINVGFDESMIVFIKAIDPDSNILSENWSFGVGIYSNDLTTILDSGVKKTLAEYYKEEVADFGQFIKALKEDAIPPATLGKTPNAPTIDAENFQVVQINEHLTQNDAAVKVKRLNVDKINVQEALKNLDDTIVKKRSTVSTKKYMSLIERDRDRNELKSLIDTRSSEAKLYGSIVNQIKAVASDQQITKIEPKFRIRGFWSVPEPKIVAETIPQEVVQFIVQYRYLSASGKTSRAAQLKFSDGSTERTGVFSNWNEIKSGVRSRVKDATTGKYYWGETSVEDGQEVNFNQLDIPIQKGELVEIRVKSVSEAGFPANPITSDWSDVVRVSFPEGTLDTADISTLVAENETESAIVRVNEDLESKGVYSHVGDSFIANEKYFAHTATTIASGFLSPEQTPISLFDKLTALQNEVQSLQETISGIKGELSVKLISEEGTTTNINKNTNNKVFAGYYSEEVADLTIKKGHIVTKTFKLLLENTNATQLELIARIVGDRDLPAYRSSSSASDAVANGFGINPDVNSSINGKVIDDTYYTTEGKYDLVPIQYQNLSQGEDALTYEGSTYNYSAPYQSSQRRGQFVYSRFADIANDRELYTVTPLDTLGTIFDYEYGTSYSVASTNLTEDATSSNFLWAGSFGIATANGLNPAGTTYDLSVTFGDSVVDVVSVGSGAGVGTTAYDSGIFLHKDHPDLVNLYASYSASAASASAMTATEMNTAIASINNNALYTMSILSTYDGEATDGKKQLGYRSSLLPNGVDTRTLKMSFDANDQYLLGGRSCGSYLFLSPTNTDSLLVDGDNKFGRKYVTTGEANAVSIDVVFQYRMTDYAGDNPASDIGRVGGQLGTNITNLTYAKRIGIDIFDSDSEQFSFDLEVFAKYKSAGSNKNSIKAAQLSI